MLYRGDWKALSSQVCMCGLLVESHCLFPTLILPLISCIISGDFLDYLFYLYLSFPICKIGLIIVYLRFLLKYSWFTMLHLFQVIQIFACVCTCVHTCSVVQLCPTLFDPLDCNLPGSFVWDFLGKNTEVGCHVPLQGIFPTQASNLCLLCLLSLLLDRRILYPEPQEKGIDR